MGVKLQKQSGRITLNWYQKPSFFTKEIKLSLLIALFIHIFWLIVFPIDWKSFITTKDSPIAIQVMSDSIKETIAESSSIRTLPEYPEHLFSYNRIALQKHLPSISTILPKSSKENSSYYDRIHYFPLPVVDYQNLFSLRICEGYPIDFQPSKSPKSTHPCKAQLEFQALTQIGAIVWLKWKESTGNEALDRECENYLHEIRLKITSSEYIVRGSLEMEFL